jgi:hypothetical protein
MLYAVFLAIAASSLQATTLLSQQGSPRGLVYVNYVITCHFGTPVPAAASVGHPGLLPCTIAIFDSPSAQWLCKAGNASSSDFANRHPHKQHCSY